MKDLFKRFNSGQLRQDLILTGDKNSNAVPSSTSNLKKKNKKKKKKFPKEGTSKGYSESSLPLTQVAEPRPDNTLSKFGQRKNVIDS